MARIKSGQVPPVVPGVVLRVQVAILWADHTWSEQVLTLPSTVPLRHIEPEVALLVEQDLSAVEAPRYVGVHCRGVRYVEVDDAAERRAIATLTSTHKKTGTS